MKYEDYQKLEEYSIELNEYEICFIKNLLELEFESTNSTNRVEQILINKFREALEDTLENIK